MDYNVLKFHHGAGLFCALPLQMICAAGWKLAFSVTLKRSCWLCFLLHGHIRGCSESIRRTHKWCNGKDWVNHGEAMPRLGVCHGSSLAPHQTVLHPQRPRLDTAWDSYDITWIHHSAFFGSFNKTYVCFNLELKWFGKGLVIIYRDVVVVGGGGDTKWRNPPPLQDSISMARTSSSRDKTTPKLVVPSLHHGSNFFCPHFRRGKTSLAPPPLVLYPPPPPPPRNWWALPNKGRRQQLKRIDVWNFGTSFVDVIVSVDFSYTNN